MVGQVDEGRLVAGRYRLLERIGRGGMGTVWLAEDELLGRRVAVKKLHPPQPHMLEEELATLFERTRREARAAARISHPNVIVVHDVVDDAGLPSIVMEYVPSVTLGERLKEQGALPPAEAARIGRGMVAALRAAHRAGVLHRDVKPGNVLLGDDQRIVLTDFGIAQASGTSTLTRTGELIGSIDFLSPERIRGAMPGPEADLWALGATLYQAVEGASAFRRPTAIETAYAIAEDPVRPPANAGALAEVITGLLAKEPGRRLSAEDAERMLRIPAAEADTALVDRGRFEYPSQGEPSIAGVTGGAAANGASYGESHTGGPGAPGGDPGDSRSGGHGSPLDAASGPEDPTHRPHRLAEPTPAPPARRRRRRVVPWLAALAVVVLAAGAVFGVRHYRTGTTADGRDGTGGPTAPVSTAPTATAPSTSPPSSPPAVPEGYHLAKQADRGYSVPVPDGWTKQVKNGGDEVDWVDSSGLVGLKVSALDFASDDPYQHFLTLEPQTRAAVDKYHRGRMVRTTAFGGPAALWEFTFKGSVRDWHAIDLGFGKPGGTEYAIYLSAPEAQWLKYRPVFDKAAAGFRQTG
jgi:eukaryotic-like serine/threonine-protein kinase